MIIVVDENIPKMTVQGLRDEGHVVWDLRGTTDQGADDETVWRNVQLKQALLITTDKGFTRYRSEEHYGILIIRLRQPNLAKIHSRVMMAVDRRKSDDWPNLTVVVRDTVQSIFRYRSET